MDTFLIGLGLLGFVLLLFIFADSKLIASTQMTDWQVKCERCGDVITCGKHNAGGTTACPTCTHLINIPEVAKADPAPPAHASAPAMPRSGGSGFICWAMIFAGVAGLIYFAAFFDVSVPTKTGNMIINLKLANDRTTGLICSAVAALLGGVLMIAAGQRKKT